MKKDTGSLKQYLVEALYSSTAGVPVTELLRVRQFGQGEKSAQVTIVFERGTYAL